VLQGGDNGVCRGVLEGRGVVEEGLSGGKGEKSSSESLSEDKKSDTLVFVVISSCCWGGKSGIRVFTCPIAVKGLTLFLLTRIARPFLIMSSVPLENTLVTRYGPSHLSSIFSLVFRNMRLSRKTNCPGFMTVSLIPLS
jgi:hypothetical protein